MGWEQKGWIWNPESRECPQDLQWRVGEPGLEPGEFLRSLMLFGSKSTEYPDLLDLESERAIEINVNSKAFMVVKVGP